MAFTKQQLNELFNPAYSGDAFIIAEMSANHNGSLERAKDTIKAASDSGADAIKLQTYTPDTMTIETDNPLFRITQGTLWDGVTLYELYKTAFTPWEWHAELFKTAEQCGILCLSTPFDKSAVDFLEQFDPPVTKIASFETNDIPLIEYAASKGRPMIISTGLSDETEIMEAAAACHRMHNRKVALLKCTSAYPAPPEELNLLTIPDMAARFGVTAGLSDHTMGTEAACAAVALGAKIIEKHFIINRKEKGPDSEFSMEPSEFRAMTDRIRLTEKTLGKIVYTPSEFSNKSKIFKRSLFAVKDIKSGETFTADNVRSIRPGFGLAPKHYTQILHKKATRDIVRATPLTPDMISGFKADN